MEYYLIMLQGTLGTLALLAAVLLIYGIVLLTLRLKDL